MSQEMQTKPGVGLADLLSSSMKLQAAIVLEGTGQEPGGAEVALGVLLEKFVDTNLSPDDVKFLIDQLQSRSDSYQIQSDQQGHIAMMMAHSANTISSRFSDGLRKAGIDQIKGDTWTARVQKSKPRLDIDWAKIGSDGKDYMREISVVDEAKVMSALAAGVDVPGIKMEETYEVEFFVEKKAAQ